MNDRFEELRIKDPLSIDEDDLESALDEITLEDREDLYRTDTPEDSKFIEGFHAEVGNVKSLLDEIENDCEDLRRVYQKSFTSVHEVGTEGGGGKYAQVLINQRKYVTDKLKTVKNKIKGMEDEMRNLKNEKKVTGNGGDGLFKTAEYRMRENLYVMILRRTQSVITEFQKIEVEYQDKKREEVKRRLRIAKKRCSNDNSDEEIEIGDEEVERYLKDSKQVFIQRISTSTATRTAESHYDEAMETRMDLLDLETRMNELVDIFTDLDQLLKLQGDNIDNIQDSVASSINYVEKGTKHIVKGRKHQGRTKCLCIIAVILASILTILVIMILAVIIFGGASGLSALAAGLAIGL